MPFCLRNGSWLVIVIAFTLEEANGSEADGLLLFSRDPLSLRPQLECTTILSDNVFYGENERVADVQMLFAPGIILGLGTEDANYVHLTYRHERVLHLIEQDQSADQHHLLMDVRYNSGRVAYEAVDGIQFLSGLLGGGISLRRQRVDRMVIQDHHRVTWRLTEKNQMYLKAVHSTYDYANDLPLYDFRKITGGAGFVYQVQERLELDVEHYHGYISLHPNRDLPHTPGASLMGGYVGLHAALTEKITAKFRAGLEGRDFRGTTPGADLPVLDAVLLYQMTANRQLSASYSRQWGVSMQFTGSDYVVDQLNVRALQILGAAGRTTLTMALSYGHYVFGSSQSYSHRSDQVLEARVELSHLFKRWFKGVFALENETFQSDLPRLENYRVNRVTVGVVIGY